MPPISPQMPRVGQISAYPRGPTFASYTIARRQLESCLPSEEDVLIIRQTRNEGSVALPSGTDSDCRSRKIQGAILMKKILVTVVLGVAALAAAQDAAQPAQGQPSASTTQAP